MKSKLYCKILAWSIIFLFIGVSFSSAISVDTRSVIENEEECKECNKVDNADLIKVERLLDRVEVYSKLLLVLSRYNPELKEVSEELSDDIIFLRNTDLKDLICNIILNIADKCTELMKYYANLANNYQSQGRLILSFSLAGIALSFDILHLIFYYDIYNAFDCPEIPD
jgi:hypothetical protein